MKKTLLLISFAVSLLCLSTQAQVLNSVSLSSNSIPIAATNPVASTPWFVGGQKQCTLFVSVTPATNTVGVAVGTGSSTFTVSGSPAATGGTFYALNTNGSVTLTYNGTNTVSGYLVVDTTMFQQLEIASVSNTGTNLVWTNAVASYLLK